MLKFKIFGSHSYVLLVELKYGQEIFVTMQIFVGNITFVTMIGLLI